MNIDITFGVLNYNPNNHPDAQDALTKCLVSLYQNKNRDLSSEVYIIDQGSINDKQQYVINYAIQSFGWRSIFLDRNVGISRGINLLARIARGNHICLVTSDTEFSKGLDTTLINDLKQNPNVWQICPASDNASLDYQRQGYQSHDLAYRLAAQELTIQMWPRKTFETIGYFDERWKACFENMDYALRIFMAGGNIAVSHNAFCHHDLGMSMKTGARDKSYDGYINMPNGFNQDILHSMWNKKWSGVNWKSLYEEPKDEWRKSLLDNFQHNMHLGYVQDPGY